MSVLSGIYTPDVEIVSTNIPGTTVLVANRPTPVIAATVSGVGSAATLKIEVGTIAGFVFTPVQVIGYVAAPNGATNQVPILFVARAGQAIRITAT